MAPVARRGAKSVKWNREPQLGDLVLAKVKGYPFWPAKVSRPEDWNQEPTPRKFFVLFFGTKEIAFLALQDLLPFTEEVKSDLVNQAREKRFPKRHAKGLEEALVEICKAYDELPKSSETANGVLPDRTLDMSVKPTESLVKPPDDGEIPRVEHMEVDSSVDNLNTLRHSSGTEENMKDGGHDRKDILPTGINRKKPAEKDSDLPKKKKPVTSKSAMDMHLEQMEVDSSVDNLNTLRHGSGTEENVKDGGHDRKDTFSTVTNRKKSVEKDSDHPQKKKAVTSKSAINMDLEQARSPTSLFSGRETEDQKVGKEGHPTEGVLLDCNVEIVCALEVPTKDKPKMQLKNADREENKHADGTGISGRSTPEALPDTVPTNSADKESGGFKKLKPRMKQSLTDKSERRGPNKVMLDKPNKQLTGKSPVVLSSNKKSVPGSGQRKPEGSSDMRPAKRPKLVDRANEAVKTGAKSELKLPVDNGKDSSVKSEKSTSAGARNNTFPETVTADGRTRKSGVVVSPLPRPHSGRMEQAPGSATKLTEKSMSFDDDEEEEQRTPPHKTVAKSISTHVTPTVKIHQTGSEIPSSQVGNVSAKKSGLAREEKPRSVGRSPVKHEPIYSPSQGKVHARPQMTGRKSATISVDTSSALGNKINPADRKSSGQLKNPGSSEVKRPQGSSSKAVYQTSGNSHSQSHAALEKNVLLSKSENAKVKAKPSTQIAMTVENRLSATLSDERSGKLDHSKEDRSNFVEKAEFAASNAASDKSIKDLLAAAQARRNHLASGQGNSDGSSPHNAVLASAAWLAWTKNAISEGDVMQSQDSICEPGHRVDLKKPAETDHEHEKSPKPKQSSGSLGGGMIETLSRTKDSIGRATRHAIECSKHGIAEEIVELLVRKIENEPNLHVKLISFSFGLHNTVFSLSERFNYLIFDYLGVAGASYIPSVQAALPRLLSAAAHLLWLERKIMPETVLRKYMNDIEVPNDNTHAGFLLRRPSRAERSVDDPIREMDDMLVDEYGSNTTIEFSGILSSTVFVNDEDFPRIDGSLPVISLRIIAPNSVEEHMTVLESATSDAVMEDASVLPRNSQQIERSALIEHDSRQEAGSEGALTNQYELPPLPEGPPPLPLDSLPPQPLPEGPPPLPLDSPPPPPPLAAAPPAATPPPPPPPLSPSSPPPPPPLPSGPPPQPAPPPPHPSIPPPVLSSPSSLGYQHAVPEYFRPPNGNHLTGNSSIQGVGNTPNFMPAGPVNAQAPVNYVPSLPPDYASNNIFLPQQASNGNYQFQSGVSFHQGAFSAFPSAQTPPVHPHAHHTHMNPMGQQSVPPPCNSYGVQAFPNSQSQYTSEEQWRMASGNFSPDDQHNTWLPGGRSLSCSDGSFMQDGYPRSNIDRSSMNSMSHQHAVLNHLPSGAPHPAASSRLIALSVWKLYKSGGVRYDVVWSRGELMCDGTANRKIKRLFNSSERKNPTNFQFERHVARLESRQQQQPRRCIFTTILPIEFFHTSSEPTSPEDSLDSASSPPSIIFLHFSVADEPLRKYSANQRLLAERSTSSNSMSNSGFSDNTSTKTRVDARHTTRRKSKKKNKKQKKHFRKPTDGSEITCAESNSSTPSVDMVDSCEGSTLSPKHVGDILFEESFSPSSCENDNEYNGCSVASVSSASYSDETELSRPTTSGLELFGQCNSSDCRCLDDAPNCELMDSSQELPYASRSGNCSDTAKTPFRNDCGHDPCETAEFCSSGDGVDDSWLENSNSSSSFCSENGSRGSDFHLVISRKRARKERKMSMWKSFNGEHASAVMSKEPNTKEWSHRPDHVGSIQPQHEVALKRSIKNFTQRRSNEIPLKDFESGASHNHFTSPKENINSKPNGDFDEEQNIDLNKRLPNAVYCRESSSCEMLSNSGSVPTTSESALDNCTSESGESTDHIVGNFPMQKTGLQGSFQADDATGTGSGLPSPDPNSTQTDSVIGCGLTPFLEGNHRLGKFSSSEMHLIEMIKVVNDAYEVQVAADAYMSAGYPITDLETFLYSATPVIGHVPCVKNRNCSQDQVFRNPAYQQYMSNINLRNIWEWYEEPGCYGLEVRDLDDLSSMTSHHKSSEFSAYFVPYLSAIQLFGWSTKNMDNGVDVQEGGLLGASNTTSVLSPQPVPAKLHKPFEQSNTSFSESSSSAHAHGELIFEYFETEQPSFRPPLFEKIKELSCLNVSGDSEKLQNVKLHDLHPASWYCVAWYPVYRVPHGNFRAAFLTYHSLGKLVPQICSPDFSGGQDTRIVCPAVGLQSYNDKGEQWFELRCRDSSKPSGAEVVEERLRTLKRGALAMARAVIPRGSEESSANHHPDYEFFLSRST
ncbi:hypothetical protein ZWY2020_003149 [Hordeum vulgare]|nr:hypothetical protein ZWY2020_003149 [Hordeum vulgare]